MSILVTFQFIVLYFIILQFYPFKIVELKEFKITDKQVKAGDMLNFNLEFVKNYSFKGDIQWFFVDGIYYLLPNNGSVYKNIGLSSSKRKLFIPKNLPPDTYIIHVDISYKITPFRQVNYVWQSNSFEVIK